MREAVVVAHSRTPLAKSFRGSFNLTRPDDLAAHCITDVLKKVPQLDPAEIEDIYMGCANPEHTQGMNVARVAAIRAGLPVTVAGCTINRFCSSWLQAVAMASHLVLNENVDVALRGEARSLDLRRREVLPERRGDAILSAFGEEPADGLAVFAAERFEHRQ